MRRQDLDGDRALQARIACAIHLTHPARAQRRADFVRHQFCTRAKAHLCARDYSLETNSASTKLAVCAELPVSIVMQVLKQRVARTVRPKRPSRNPNQQLLFQDDQAPQFWQAGYYDFNVYS